MNLFDLHGAEGIAKSLETLAIGAPAALKGFLTEAAADIRRRHTSDRAYSLLCVSLRNALFRVSESNTALCPSPIFRALEAGEIGVGEATDRVEIILRMLAAGVAKSNLEADYDGDRP